MVTQPDSKLHLQQMKGFGSWDCELAIFSGMDFEIGGWGTHSWGLAGMSETGLSHWVKSPSCGSPLFVIVLLSELPFRPLLFPQINHIRPCLLSVRRGHFGADEGLERRHRTDRFRQAAPADTSSSCPDGIGKEGYPGNR